MTSQSDLSRAKALGHSWVIVRPEDGSIWGSTKDQANAIFMREDMENKTGFRLKVRPVDRGRPLTYRLPHITLPLETR